MKRTIFHIMAAAAVLLAAISCKEDTIDSYRVEDCAVVFHSSTNEFSLKGVSEPVIELAIPVELVGPMTEYPREIGIMVEESELNTAVEGKDFVIKSHVLDSNLMKTNIILEVNNLAEGVEKLATTLRIVRNDCFREGYPQYSKAYISWSKEYVRPIQNVWRYWYTYISHGYSKKYHELLLQIIDPGMEYFTGSRLYASEDPTLTYKSPDWWMGAGRMFRQAVIEHDNANPDDPYMHSPDYMRYTSYTQAVSEGKKVEPTPTILETLENF